MNLIDTHERAPEGPEAQDVRAHLIKILQSRFFASAPRLTRFLDFVVNESLNGREHNLKEYSVALSVFGKPENFDPRLDSSVRVAARQLRARLEQYYSTDGRGDRVRITMKPGEYKPCFYCRQAVAYGAETNGDANRDSEQPVTAIVVDEHRSTRAELAQALDVCGCATQLVTDSADDVLKALSSNSPSFIVTGLTLPGRLNGIELMREVRASSGAGIIGVIPIETNPVILRDLAAVEPDAVIVRPVRIADVKVALQLAGARLRNGAHGSPIPHRTPLALELAPALSR